VTLGRGRGHAGVRPAPLIRFPSSRPVNLWLVHVSVRVVLGAAFRHNPGLVSMTRPAPSEDAALVLALAGTAMPFADSPESEAEHWIRILRVHGEAGRVLQSLGVGEEPLERTGRVSARRPHRVRRGDENVVDLVLAHAEDRAAERGRGAVDTIDVLCGVRAVYGHFFADALDSRGVTPEELRERILR